jgi:hypothetical protein
MKIHHSQPSRLIGAFIGAVAAISIALPATAGAAPANEPAQFGASQTKHAQVASSSSPALRRDGSKAAPFVADLGPKAPATNGDFDWGDAAIGAGAITGIIALGLGGALGVRRLKASPHRHRMPAATSS